jgi:hypothetical protein
LLGTGSLPIRANRKKDETLLNPVWMKNSMAIDVQDNKRENLNKLKVFHPL